MNSRVTRYVERHFDELAIATSLGRLLARRTDLDEDDEFILEAFRRSTPALKDAGTDELRDYLSQFDNEQLIGVASNVKGIAHEIRYVEIENDDGDSVSAVLFGDPTHEHTDIVMRDDATGAARELQLKATDDAGSVREWIDAHPDGEIAVTSELAERLEIEDSGIANQPLTAHVEDVIDRALDEPSLWDDFPLLTVASLSVVLVALCFRYRRGEISLSELRRAMVSATGWKLAKISLLIALLSVPVVNVVTGAVIAARLILAGRAALVGERVGG